MLIWIEGSLNPNELRERVLKEGEEDFRNRLLLFLDDTISNCVPIDPDPTFSVPSTNCHPCTVRGIDLKTNADIWQKSVDKDLHHLVQRCQSHTHSKTCFKYWKGPPEPKVCRSDLHEDNYYIVLKAALIQK